MDKKEKIINWSSINTQAGELGWRLNGLSLHRFRKTQKKCGPTAIVQHLSPRLLLIFCLPQTWSSSPFCPTRATLRCIFLLSHPFSMSLSLSMSLASRTSFLFLWCSPSSLPCLLQQKIQHRHQHVCLCMPLYDGSAGKPHMLMSKEVIKKKTTRACLSNVLIKTLIAEGYITAMQTYPLKSLE